MSNPPILKQYLIDADSALHAKDPSTVHYRNEFVMMVLSCYLKDRLNHPEPFEGADEIANDMIDKVTSP